MYTEFVEQLLIILAAGLAAGFLCRVMNLPPLMGYLATGAILGQGALHWVSAGESEIRHLAEIGVFLLLFSIGLELSPEEMRRMSRHLLTGGPIQMLLVAAPVAWVLSGMGMPISTAVLLGSALAFSSTVLVFQSLGELGQTTTMVGRRTIAILLFQDAALVPLLLCLPLLADGASVPGLLDWVRLALISIMFLAGTLLLRELLTRIAIPRITRYRSADLVVLLTITVLGIVTLLASRMGLPPAIGAFAAGVAFGGNRWSEQIDTLILPFREVFSAIFFVSLGLLINLSAVIADPVAIGLGLAGLIVLKWMAAVVALVVTGLPWRGTLLPALGLAHVGEFAFVLFLFASSTTVISVENQQRLLGIAGGTLLCAPVLIRLGFRSQESDSISLAGEAVVKPHDDEPYRSAVVIGMGPVGRAVVLRLETLGYEVHAMDLNPLNLQSFAQLGIPIVAGDATTASVLKAGTADRASLVIVCVPVDEVAIRITTAVRHLNSAASIIVRCRYAKNQETVKKAGATAVVSEESQAANELIRIIQ